MEIIGQNEIHDREIRLLFLPDISALPVLELSNDYFGAFLACNADIFSDELVLSFAEQLLQQGLVYIDVWGKDCERVHDLFDEAI